jgi:hypothetical protein
MSVVDTCRLPVDGGDAVFCEVTGHGPPLVLTHDGVRAEHQSLSQLLGPAAGTFDSRVP